MWQAPDFWTKRGLMSDVLAPVGWAHAGLSAARRSIVRPFHAAVPVICVGNLVAGGAGKTPVVLSLAQSLQERGFSAHILSRGYGGSLKGPLRVDPARHTADQVGDEPLLLAAAAPVWIGGDRIASAKAATLAGAEFLLLDDGFQNPSLHHDVALLVIDGGYGIGNGRIIPAGPLREPAPRALQRASAVVVMGRAESALDLGGTPVLRAALTPREAEDLRGARVVAFAGIGRPAKFFATLEELGAVLVETRGFPDHHRYDEAALAALDLTAQRQKARLVTTEKDWVRLPPAWRDKIRALKVAVRWEDAAALDGVLAAAVGRRDGTA